MARGCTVHKPLGYSLKSLSELWRAPSQVECGRGLSWTARVRFLHSLTPLPSGGRSSLGEWHLFSLREHKVMMNLTFGGSQVQRNAALLLVVGMWKLPVRCVGRPGRLRALAGDHRPQGSVHRGQRRPEGSLWATVSQGPAGVPAGGFRPTGAMARTGSLSDSRTEATEGAA